MSDSNSSKGRTIFHLVMVTVMGLLIYLTVVTFLPQDLSDIEGRDSADSALNLRALLESSVEKQTPFSLTEAQLNAYLAKHVTLKQKGWIADKLKMKTKGVMVRLEQGEMEIILEREVMGYDHTVSMFLKAKTLNDEHGRPFLALERSGARLGTQNFPPVYVLLVQDAFLALKDAVDQEIETGFRSMSSIKFMEGKIEFDPRPIEVNPFAS